MQQQNKLILTIGVAGSGKSTWANEACKADGVVNINRDSLRSMVKALDKPQDWKFSKKKAAMITDLMMPIIDVLFETNHTVIVSDTNLNPETRNKFKLYYPDIIEHKVFDVPWKELIRRNQYRGDKAVPIDVLRRMFGQMREYLDLAVYSERDAHYKPKAIIVDVDGTLADNSHRHPFDFDKVLEDKPIDKIVRLVNLYKDSGHKIIVVSGRDSGEGDSCYQDTFNWITDTLGYNPDEFFMRAFKDGREDSIVKEDIFWKEIAPYYNIEVVLDDRSTVVEMWRYNGLTCLQVAAGDF